MKIFGTIMFLLGFILNYSVMTEVGEWQKEWEKAKKEYELATGKHKPTEKFWGIFRKNSGIGDSLKKLDQSFKPFLKEKSFNAKNLKNFKNALKVFSTKKEEYIKVLKDAILKEQKFSLISEINTLEKKLTYIEKAAERQIPEIQQYITILEAIAASVDSLKKAIVDSKIFVGDVEKAGKHSRGLYNTKIQNVANSMNKHLSDLREDQDSGRLFLKGKPASFFCDALLPYFKGKKTAQDDKSFGINLTKFKDILNEISKWVQQDFSNVSTSVLKLK